MCDRRSAIHDMVQLDACWNSRMILSTNVGAHHIHCRHACVRLRYAPVRTQVCMYAHSHPSKIDGLMLAECTHAEAQTLTHAHNLRRLAQAQQAAFHSVEVELLKWQNPQPLPPSWVQQHPLKLPPSSERQQEQDPPWQTPHPPVSARQPREAASHLARQHPLRLPPSSERQQEQDRPWQTPHPPVSARQPREAASRSARQHPLRLPPLLARQHQQLQGAASHLAAVPRLPQARGVAQRQQLRMHSVPVRQLLPCQRLARQLRAVSLRLQPQLLLQAPLSRLAAHLARRHQRLRHLERQRRQRQ